MRKFHRVLSTLLLTTKKQPKVTGKILARTFLLSTFFLTLTWHQLLTQNTKAQAQPTSGQFSWQAIFQNNDPPVPEKPGTRRGDRSKLCALAPEQWPATNHEVWSAQPLFVWQGDVKQIEVRSQDNQKTFWQKTIQGANSVLYAGEPLQPGQTYNWVIFDQQNTPRFLVPFKVMDAEKHEQINTQLQTLEKELNAKGATPEESAMRRAQFFAQQKLWSDFWREVFSVENPSTALTELVKTTTTDLCKKATAPNPLPSP